MLTLVGLPVLNRLHGAVTDFHRYLSRWIITLTDTEESKCNVKCNVFCPCDIGV